jgi:hypothetical protein
MLQRFKCLCLAVQVSSARGKGAIATQNDRHALTAREKLLPGPQQIANIRVAAVLKSLTPCIRRAHPTHAPAGDQALSQMPALSPEQDFASTTGSWTNVHVKTGHREG